MQNNIPRQKLQEFIKRYGTISCEDTKRCESFLRDSVGEEHKRAVFILVNAIREGIPKDLLNPPTDLPLDSVSSRLVQRLYENQGIDTNLAHWAVESWRIALGIEAPFAPQDTWQPETTSPPPSSPSVSSSQKTLPKPVTKTLLQPDSDNLLRTLAGHRDWIASIAFSSNGHSLASASFDTSVRLWEVATGKLLRTLAREPKPSDQGKEEEPKGTLSKVLHVFSRPPNKSKPKPAKPTEKGHEDWVFTVAYSPKGGTLASGSRDNTVRLWNLKTGEEVHTFKQGSGRRSKTEVYSVAYSRDGQTLASASKDRIIRLWDTFTGEALRILKGHEDWVFYVTYSPDEHTLASASRDNTIKLWDFKKGKLLRTLVGHAAGVSLLAYSPDGNTLASASYDQTIKLWNLATGQELSNFTGYGTVYSIAYSPNGKFLASGNTEETGSSIKIWEIRTGKVVQTLYGHKSRIESLAYNPDGSILASASYDKTIKLWKM